MVVATLLRKRKKRNKEGERTLDTEGNEQHMGTHTREVGTTRKHTRGDNHRRVRKNPHTETKGTLQEAKGPPSEVSISIQKDSR